jgi:hypothetical protein
VNYAPHFAEAHSQSAAQKRAAEKARLMHRLARWKSYFQCCRWRNHENRMLWGNQGINGKANCRRNLKLLLVCENTRLPDKYRSIKN